MPRLRRVYRATAIYDDCLLDTTRHFLTKRARDRWAAQRTEGYSETPPDLLGDSLPAIPPARAVEVADSNPVTWP